MIGLHCLGQFFSVLNFKISTGTCSIGLHAQATLILSRRVCLYVSMYVCGHHLCNCYPKYLGNEAIYSFVSNREPSAYSASIGDVIDDVTWLYGVILVMSRSSKSSHSETRTRINCPGGQMSAYRFLYAKMLSQDELLAAREQIRLLACYSFLVFCEQTIHTWWAI